MLGIHQAAALQVAWRASSSQAFTGVLDAAFLALNSSLRCHGLMHPLEPGPEYGLSGTDLRRVNAEFCESPMYLVDLVGKWLAHHCWQRIVIGLDPICGRLLVAAYQLTIDHDQLFN